MIIVFVKLRQGDCCQFQASLGWTVEALEPACLAWVVEFQVSE